MVNNKIHIILQFVTLKAITLTVIFCFCFSQVNAYERKTNGTPSQPAPCYYGGIGHGDHETSLENFLLLNYFGDFNKTKVWSDPLNWNLKRVPFENEEAIVRADARVDNSFTHTNLKIDSGSVTIPPSRINTNINFLNIKNNITIASSLKYNGLIIKADANSANGSLIFHNSRALPVPATVEMYVKAKAPAWQFAGIPVQSADYNTAFPLINYPNLRMARYKESSIPKQWDETIRTAGNGAMKPFEAYAVSNVGVNDTLVYTGNLVNYDSIFNNLTRTGAADIPGNHLISNPYTAAIRIDSLKFTGSIKPTVYLFNTGTFDQWQAWLDMGAQSSKEQLPGQYTAIPQKLAGSFGLPTTISSMQAFLVLAKTGTNSLKIPYSAVQANGTKKEDLQRVKRSSQTEAKVNIEDEYPSTKINVKGAVFEDNVTLITIPTCSKAYDSGYDGDELGASKYYPQLYTHESQGDYSIDVSDDVNGTLMMFKAGVDVNYTLTFTHKNLEKKYEKLYLIDLVNNYNVTDITSSGTTYSFADADTIVHERFRIGTIPVKTDVDEVRDAKLTVFNFNRQLYVKNDGYSEGILSVYDVAGKFLKSIKFTPSSTTMMQIDFPMGVYVVKAISDKRFVTKSIIVN